MNRQINLSLTFLCCFMLSCCSTLKIDISIIDRDKLKRMPSVMEEEVLRYEQAYLTNKANGSYELYKNTLKTRLTEHIVRIVQSYISQGTFASNQRDQRINDFKVFFDHYIEPKFDSIASLNEKGLEYSRLAKLAKIDSTRKNSLYEAKKHFLAADYLLNNVLTKQSFGSLSLGAIPASDFISTSNIISVISDAKQTTDIKFIAKEDELLHDILASTIIHAPDSMWKRKKDNGNYSNVNYKKVKAYTYLGNADIAFVMRGPADYTIKGVRVDGSKVAQNGYKLISQGVMVYANMMTGLPLLGNTTLSSTSGSSETTQTVNNSIHSTTLLKSKLHTYRKISDASIINLMESMINQHSKIATDPASSVTIIKSSFDSYKTQINPSTN